MTSPFRSSWLASGVLLAAIALAPVARAQGPSQPASTSTRTLVALTPLEAAPQVLGGRGATLVTLRLPPGAIPPAKVRIGVFAGGGGAKLADFSRPFVAGPNGLQTQISFDADPGRYDIRLLRPDKTRAPLTQSATVTVAGIERAPGWWLFNGSPVLASGTPLNAPLFWPGLKRSLGRSDKSRTASARSDTAVLWRTMPFPPLAAWLRDASAARDSALALAQAARASGGGFVGCAMFAARASDSAGAALSAEDESTLSRSTPEAIATAVTEARRTCESISPQAPLILSLESLPATVAARVVDLAAPECDAVHFADFGGDDVAAWPLKVARRVAEEQPEFDLPIFVSPRDEASAAEALMSGATAFVQGEPNGDVAPAVRILDANLSLFVGSVTLEDFGLLRAGDALSLFRRARAIGRVPLLARTLDVAARRDRSNREGRRFGEPFALRWAQGGLPGDVLSAVRDATRDGARVYLEGNPFSPGSASGEWSELLQSRVRLPETSEASSSTSDDDYSVSAAASRGASATLKMDDVWTFGVARGQSVPVQQTVAAVPLRTPSPQEMGDAPPPRGQSDRDREAIRPAPRVVATLSDGSPGTLISPATSSLRRDAQNNFLPRGEIVWTPHLVPSTSTSSASAGSIAAYDAAISTLLQPALVRLFDRADASLSEATGVRVAVRATPRGTLLLALVNPSDSTRSLLVRTQAAGGYAVDLAANRTVPTRTRGLRVEMEVDVPARGFRLFALSRDAKAFEEDRSARRPRARVK